LFYSIGVLVNKEGIVSDINPDSAAAKAGLAPGMKITKVGGEDFSADNLRKAVAATKNNSPLEIVAENGGSSETYKISYRGGLRYPHLERVAGKPDVISEIIEPHGFIFQVSSGSRPRPRPNGIANVTDLLLSQTEITTNCPTNSSPCENGRQTIDITTVAIDPENDVLAYNYTLSAGRIIGQGAKVIWDLTGVKPGTYTITAGVDDGCGVCGKTITKTVKVSEIGKSH
jgi:membrane-associated protease RseP (regulator of RpoE activity)